MAVHLALTAYISFGLRRLEEEHADLQWRNLDVRGSSEGPEPLPDPVQRFLPLDGLRLLAAVEIFVLAGLALVVLGVPTAPIVLAILAALLAAAIAAVGARAWRSAAIRSATATWRWPTPSSPSRPRSSSTSRPRHPARTRSRSGRG